MPKLTKTEQKIYDGIKRSPRGYWAEVWTTGRGPDGGRLNYGKRAFSACIKLEEKGLVERVDVHRSINYCNGYGEHSSEIVIRLPNAE